MTKTILVLLFLSAFASADEGTTSNSTYFKTTFGLFQDDNVGQSTAFPGSANAGAPPGSGPATVLGRPNNTIIYNDNGMLGGLDIEPTFFKFGKQQIGMIAAADATVYQTYASYDYESLKAGPTWQWSDDKKTYSASLYYQETFYQSIESQDYIKLESSLSTSDETLPLSISFNWTQYARTHTDEYYFSIPVGLDWNQGEWKWSAVLTPTYGSGSAGSYLLTINNPNYTAPVTLTSGDEFARYLSFGGTLGVTKKFGDKWQVKLEISETETSYQSESIPSIPPGPNGTYGIAYGARYDNQLGATLDTKYQIRPEHWSTELSMSYLRSWSEGYQGLPANGSPPTSYTFDRPYYALSLVYEN